MWREVYDGGSAEAEQKIFDKLAQDIVAIQRKMANRAQRRPDRTLHAKLTIGIGNARLVVSPTLPQELAAGYFKPSADLPVTIRFSNASPIHQPDTKADMRGVALKVDTGAGYHDLLMTSYPVSHARNARQFVQVAKIATGPRRLVLPRLVLALGPLETLRILRNIRAASVPCPSLALQAFWSRAPILWGEAGPVRFSLRPLNGPGEAAPLVGNDALTGEFAARLRQGELRYSFLLQRYVDEQHTPIEDGAAEWREDESIPLHVATLVIPRQEIGGDQAVRRSIDGMSFNPWNSPAPFKPLGNLNRARGPVYGASARGWQSS